MNTRIRSISEAESRLQKYVPAVKELTGLDLSLDRVMPLLAALGNPQNKLRVIHVAGTSGKTSTSYYIAALLRASGAKVGLTVSPHIDSVTERVQLNGQPLSDDDFCCYLEEFLNIAEGVKELRVSYFEITMVFALWVFAKLKVDYAVVETGMGGLLDTSNVIQNADKVCLITDIGFDHTHILGNTIYEIATQKVGIIHEKNTAFLYQQSHDVMKALRERVESKEGSNYNIVKQDSGHYYDDRLPDFQERNWRLAYEAYKYIARRDNLPNIRSLAISKTRRTYIPARMDTIHLDSKTIIMDGAHNEQKMKTLVDSYVSRYSKQETTVVLALKKGKDANKVLAALSQITDILYITSFATTQDLPAVSMDPDLLAIEATKLGFTNVQSIKDMREAFSLALKSNNKNILVTGSFYLIAQLRELEDLKHNY